MQLFNPNKTLQASPSEVSIRLLAFQGVIPSNQSRRHQGDESSDE